MKVCFKCGEKKELGEFYKHPKMADGHLNKCKECTKRDVSGNRKSRIDYYREYDRNRGNRQTKEYLDESRKKWPGRTRAHQLVAYHLKKGNLVREPCEVCGSEEVHAHHDDYNKPLNVRWLCPAHHSEWHKENGPGKNR